MLLIKGRVLLSGVIYQFDNTPLPPPPLPITCHHDTVNYNATIIYVTRVDTENRIDIQNILTVVSYQTDIPHPPPNTPVIMILRIYIDTTNKYPNMMILLSD